MDNNDYNQGYNNMENVDIYNSPVIKKFNWGAFIDPIFWGIGNKSYLTLLTLIPVFNIFWIFVCGFKGNQWAWENGNYSSLEEFRKVQETWNRAGIARFIYAIVIVIISLIIIASFSAIIFSMMDSDFMSDYHYYNDF